MVAATGSRGPYLVSIDLVSFLLVVEEGLQSSEHESEQQYSSVTLAFSFVYSHGLLTNLNDTLACGSKYAAALVNALAQRRRYFYDVLLQVSGRCRYPAHSFSMRGFPAPKLKRRKLERHPQSSVTNYSSDPLQGQVHAFVMSST